jgi:octaprenyl-diphosphate synthase
LLRWCIDDAVDHSSLRRGMPTVNSLFSHQVSVIMGDYLYLRALRELVTLADLEAMRAITVASNEMTLGEMRQLSAFDALTFTERDTRCSFVRRPARCSWPPVTWARCAARRAIATRLSGYGERLGMAFQVADDLWTTRKGRR